MNNIIQSFNKGYLQFENLDTYNLFAIKPFNFNTKLISDKEIEIQYRQIEKILNHSFKKIINPMQNHTNIVKSVTNDNIDDRFNNVDGLVTNLKGIAIATRVADCQSILLYDNNKKVIGNIHSGWRGTLNKIIENAIKIMIEQYQCNSENIKAYILPSILKSCFEVQEDVKVMFEEKFSYLGTNNFIEFKKTQNGNNLYYIDTPYINKKVMIENGLLSKNIYISDICTKCNSQFIHSYRMDKEISGRNFAIIGLKDDLN